MDDRDDFYEPDEPVDDVLKAFQRGDKGSTVAPSRGKTVDLQIPLGAFRSMPTRGRTAYLDLPGLRAFTPVAARTTSTSAST
jgi:hypothetical protein